MSEDDSYDLAPDPVEARQAGSQAGAPTPVMPLAYQNPKAAAKKAEAEADPVIDFYMPLTLLVSGVIVESIAALIGSRGRNVMLRQTMLELGLHLVLGTAVMLIGVWIAARIRGIEFGRFWTAVMKLAAVAVAPSAVVTLLSPFLAFIPMLGGLAGLVLQFVLYFALLGAMFKMDESDTWYCVCVIFVLNVCLFFAMKALPT